MNYLDALAFIIPVLLISLNYCRLGFSPIKTATAIKYNEAIPQSGASHIGIPANWLLLYVQDPNAIAIASATGPNTIAKRLVFIYRHLKVLLSSIKSKINRKKTTIGVRHQNETMNIDEVKSRTL